MNFAASNCGRLKLGSGQGQAGAQRAGPIPQRDEETKLSSVLHKDWAQHVPAFLVSIHIGMRAGEQFQLKWRDVSFERRLISLPKTKSGKARHIPLNAIACSALQERKRAQ